MNNGYSNGAVDAEIGKQLKNHVEQFKVGSSRTAQQGEHTTLYYRNFMNSSYKIDERVIQNVNKNVKCTDKDRTLKLVIFYRNKKTRSILMKNDFTSSKDKLKCTNVVYKFICPHEDCRPREVVKKPTLVSQQLRFRDDSPCI